MSFLRDGGTLSPSHYTSTGPMSFLGLSGWLLQWLTPGLFWQVLRTGYPPSHGWGTHWLGQNRGYSRMDSPWPGMGYPNQVRIGVPQDRVIPNQEGGTPWPGMGYPLVRMEYPILGWGVTSSLAELAVRMGYPPSAGMGIPQDRTAEVVLATRRAVCLLSSHRMTFLFS